MDKRLLISIIILISIYASLSLAQDIYVYPNKHLADQRQIEYRRYTLEEAKAYQRGGSFEPYLTTGWNGKRRLTEDADAYRL